MTPLEKRLIEDMKLVGPPAGGRTQDTYLYAVWKVTNHFQTSPDQIINEQLREYLRQLADKDKYAPNTTTIALCGIKFFYQKILKSPCRSLIWPASNGTTTSSEQVDTSPSESPPAKPSTCLHCGRPMLALETIPRSRPMPGWPNAPPDHGRSARQHQSKQTANPL